MKKIAIIGRWYDSFCSFKYAKNKFKLSIYEKSRGVGGRINEKSWILLCLIMVRNTLKSQLKALNNF